MCLMRTRITFALLLAAAVLTWPATGAAQDDKWSFPGLSNEAFDKMPPGGPAPGAL